MSDLSQSSSDGFFAAGAFHRAVLGWRPVRSKSTLRMLERAGFITIPASFGKRGMSAIGIVRHSYVLEGEKTRKLPTGAAFEHKGRTFRLQWADGCFKPFLWEYKP
jgi:hypothetical protein